MGYGISFNKNQKGAIEEYLKPHGIKLEDLKKFSDKTKKAFQDGNR